MSAAPLVCLCGKYFEYNFSSDYSKEGTLAQKELAPGVWGMIGGDGLPDGQIGNSDKIEV